MLIQVGGVISADSVKIEYEGVLQRGILSIDTCTGEVERYVYREGSLHVSDNGDIEIERVVFDVTKLEVYLYKPGESVEVVQVK